MFIQDTVETRRSLHSNQIKARGEKRTHKNIDHLPLLCSSPLLTPNKNKEVESDPDRYYITFVFGPGMVVFMDGPLKLPSTPTINKRTCIVKKMHWVKTYCKTF